MEKGKTNCKPIKIALVLAVLFVTAPSLMAQQTIDINGYGSLRKGLGGEFTFVNPQGWDPMSHYQQAGPAAIYNNGIQTFCLEKGEYLYENKTYNVDLSLSARNGGRNTDDQAISGQDNISQGSAWLYESFAAGTLDGYNYQTVTSAQRNARKDSGEKLQFALWYLEDEIKEENKTDYDIDNNIFLNLAQSHFGTTDFSILKQDYTGSRIGVMNLTDHNGSHIQDQVVLTAVPAPGALILGAIGVGLTAIKNRKRF